ncbi:alpha/beta hydrolase [Paenibacillus sp. HB172176]|uniref:dienelactone hydrolase family protein n=1 Tax=Paenibacillus sp. HB172176 TaxID=2493690 RepID=UPI00143B0D51|nr:alpha/beta hydrolase [Paenibacillus sp. HB172176]
MTNTKAGSIPVIVEEPAQNGNGCLIIWQPGLRGTKEGVKEHLQRFAKEGFTAISFDPREHGERRTESKESFDSKLRENKRKHFWPIMAETAAEYPLIIDWALATYGLRGAVMAGGVSMGGDIAIAALGIDPRISAAAACISTPDWLRPGTDEAPCLPDAFAWSCYERCNPLTNLQLYAHAPAIRFLNGALDGHVPPDGARRFRDALWDVYADCPERFAITEYEDTSHLMTTAMLEDALAWFQSKSGL